MFGGDELLTHQMKWVIIGHTLTRRMLNSNIDPS